MLYLKILNTKYILKTLKFNTQLASEEWFVQVDFVDFAQVASIGSLAPPSYHNDSLSPSKKPLDSSIVIRIKQSKPLSCNMGCLSNNINHNH